MESTNVGWLKELKEAGYKYIFMPKDQSEMFYATKSKQLKNGEFRKNAPFDEFYLEGVESLPDEMKGFFIRL